ncbi:MAG TPA: cupin domain-containing protein [Polyangiaceae bacterium]|jgi:mannose-6-phosphate isomerase-like protein (cupin superfamily)|nr:cupin domain-containing protein [Polyangiaceae bacterium]
MKPITTRAQSNIEESFDWGKLTWYASRKIGNSDAMTLGRCVIGPGRENKPHLHPNCSETLVVMTGRIAHTLDADEVVLEAGDSVTIPPGVVHRARNLEQSEAVLWIAFSSADREFVPVG